MCEFFSSKDNSIYNSEMYLRLVSRVSVLALLFHSHSSGQFELVKVLMLEFLAEGENVFSLLKYLYF